MKPYVMRYLGGLVNNRFFLIETIRSVERRHSCFDPEIQRFYEVLNRKKYLCLFGAGRMLSASISLFGQEGITIDFLCDNDPGKHGNVFYGIKCISYRELKEIKKDTVIFISTYSFVEIEKQLKQDGFSDYFAFYSRFLPNLDVKAVFSKDKDDIIAAFDFLEDEKSREIYSAHVIHASNSLYYLIFRNLPLSKDQYFDEEVISFGKNETFVDIGAYDGADSIKFVNITKESYKKIYCFELSKSNYNLLNDNIAKLKPSNIEKIELINKGISDTNGFFSYIDSLQTDNSLSADGTGDDITEVVKLDDFFVNEHVTFIKMDIEGAEYNALKGAKKIISEQAPCLAISVYHNIQDLWKIPVLIKKYRSDYKIYLRAYERSPNETICYAIPPYTLRRRGINE